MRFIALIDTSDSSGDDYTETAIQKTQYR